MPANIIAFPSHRVAPRAASLQATTNNVVVLHAPQPEIPDFAPYAVELAFLERALSTLKDAMRRGDLAAAREWRDELQVMEMHTDYSDLRGRCRLALKSA